MQRADRLSLASAQLDILEKSLDEQKVYVVCLLATYENSIEYIYCYCLCRPPVPVGVDAQGRQIPGEVPKLFGGDIVEYINVSSVLKTTVRHISFSTFCVCTSLYKLYCDSSCVNKRTIIMGEKIGSNLAV